MDDKFNLFTLIDWYRRYVLAWTVCRRYGHIQVEQQFDDVSWCVRCTRGMP